MSSSVLSWLLTYLLHSTLLLGAAWAASRLLRRETLALEENLWRAALLGGILTAGLQIGLGVEPGLGAWRLSAAPAETAAPESAQARELAAPEVGAAPSRRAAVAAVPVDRLAAGSHRSPVRAAAGPGSRAVPGSAADRRLPDRSAWLVGGWALGALALLGRLAASFLILARRLADRRAIAVGRLHALLSRLLAAARMSGVSLSASSRIASPLAFGWRRREICLPDAVASEMGAARQELVLAHELAHHARRDPLWLIVARLVESVFFFQPLNRIARRRLQEIAEYRSDDWAVARTGRPLALARCLADVAEWRLRRDLPLPVPTLAAERWRLGRRVERLMDRSYRCAPPAPPRWLAPALAALLALVVLMAPGVSSGHEPAPGAAPLPPESAPAAPAAPEAAEASESPESPEAPVAPQAPRPPAAPTPPAPSSDGEATPALAPTAPEPDPAPAVRAAVAAAPAPATLATAAAPAVLAAPVAPAARAAPASASRPAALAPTASVGNGGWVLHDAPRPLAPAAELAAVNDRLALASAELGRLSASLAGALAEGPEAAEWSPEAQERLLELSRRMAEAARPDPEALARVERLSAELALLSRPDPAVLAWIEALSGELAERTTPGEEESRLVEEYAARAAEDGHVSEEERAEIERLRAELLRQMAADRAELDRLREEIRREVEASRPDREELDRLREEIRREIEASRPELEKVRRRHEERRREVLDRLEAERSEREEMRREELARRAAHDRAREREIEQLRAEIERLREELRREREDGLP